MAKRSPILGFNHNFRHRGLVFHVQTEDSGVNNPHIFTHLFNGGVILSTRKLTYDVGAAEEVVKALMQAQHKAMLKDLRRGEFDAKITDYFGSDPDLDGGITIPEPAEPTEPSAAHPMATTQRTPVIDDIEVLELDDIEVVDSREANVSQEIEVITAAIEVVESETVATATTTARDEPDDDAPLEPIGPPPLELGEPIAPLEVDAAADATVRTHRDGRRNPFDSLELDFGADPMDTLRGAAPAGPLAETPSGAVVIHAAAPESAPEPPGSAAQSPGQYARHNTGKIRNVTPGDIDEHTRGQRLPAPPSVADHEPIGKGRRPRTETLPLQSAPEAVRRAIVGSSSVIVGAPPQVVGTPRTATPSAPATTSPAARTVPSKVPSQEPSKAPQVPRRAREQASSLFGKDLISEKSLDEVILAYLSEDGSNKDDG